MAEKNELMEQDAAIRELSGLAPDDVECPCSSREQPGAEEDERERLMRQDEAILEMSGGGQDETP